MSIGKTVQGFILQNPNLSNQEILDFAKTTFPAGKTSLKCVAWYKSDLRKQGLLAKRSAGTTNEQIEFLEMKLAELKASKEE